MKDYSNSNKKESRTLPANPKSCNQLFAQFQKDPLGWYKLKTDSSLREENHPYNIIKEVKSGEEVMVLDKGIRESRFKLRLLSKEHSWVREGANFGWITDSSLVPAEAAYRKMTDEGLFWTHPRFSQNTTIMGKQGKSYFESLSKLNMTHMNREISHERLTSHDWFNDMVSKIITLLNNSRVNHYTTSEKVRAMMGGDHPTGEMKSQSLLEHEGADIQHNTQEFDLKALSNTGFLFFFIEQPEAPLRHTRFAEGEGFPARISVPIRESGLLTHGWVMLSDMAQRELPNIKTKPDNHGIGSVLPTREYAEQGRELRTMGFTQKVRTTVTDPIADMTRPQPPVDMHDDDKGTFNLLSDLFAIDAHHHLAYTKPNLPEETIEESVKFPEKYYNNILVGSDIIPGIAHRVTLEIHRINSVNPVLGAQLKAFNENQLFNLIFKHLLKPQALIPNSMIIKRAYLQPEDVLTR